MMKRPNDSNWDSTAFENAKIVLNEKLKDLIFSSTNKKTQLHLIYSKIEKEQTYQTDMKDLIFDLKSNGFQCIEKNYNFVNHGEIGLYFIDYVKNWFAM
jgi:hypothetical protein